MKFEAIELLKKFSYLGQKQLEDGTILIGKAPHIAPQAWLHCVYPRIESESIEFLERQMSIRIPKDYKDFLAVTNGLGVFNTTLSLYGYRRSYGRNVDEVWQPFDIVTPNTLERPESAGENIFIIGGYDWDGSYLYINTDTDKVCLCERENISPLFGWVNFQEMLESEVRRLTTLFDEQGKEIDINRSTLPTNKK
jgi:hypothetical protein